MEVIMSEQKNNRLNEYQDFLNQDMASVPNELKVNVFTKVKRLLKPNAWLVFLKLLGIHAVTGYLSLSVCHQFGINPFNTDSSLADWFMKIGGHNICMLGCGITFVSVSILTAGYLFTTEEVRAIKQNDLLQNLSLGIISLGVFAAFGAELALSMAGLWLVGSLAGGLVSMAAIFKIKGVSAA
jgi:hypothetical protein